MNAHRLRYYLAQIGCDDERITRRTPDEHCDEALLSVGFSPCQIQALDSRSRARRTGPVGESLALLAVDAVSFGLAVNRFEQTLTSLSLILENWDTIMRAYSVVDTIGWEVTTELMIVTARESVPVGVFLFQHSKELQEVSELLGLGAEFAALKADVVEALVTGGGVSLGLSLAAWGAVKLWNAELVERHKVLEKQTKDVQHLHVLLASGALPQAVRRQLGRVPARLTDVGGWRGGQLTGKSS